MGDSKIFMLSAIYLIVGMFLYSNHLSITGESYRAEHSADHTKAETIARAGISIALEKMGVNSSLKAFLPEYKEINGGRVFVNAAQPLGSSIIQSKITAIGIAGTDTVTVTAIASFDRGRWRLSGVFPLPSV